jgi:uncharacterized protein YodC (DUF2158 family)
MSGAAASLVVVPGSIVRLQGMPDSPNMFVLECDRSAAECVWFNRNSDLAKARFPISSLKRTNPDGKDSGEIAAVDLR